jgi:hypothetical protein
MQTGWDAEVSDVITRKCNQLRKHMNAELQFITKHDRKLLQDTASLKTENLDCYVNLPYHVTRWAMHTITLSN